MLVVSPEFIRKHDDTLYHGQRLNPHSTSLHNKTLAKHSAECVKCKQCFWVFFPQINKSDRKSSQQCLHSVQVHKPQSKLRKCLGLCPEGLTQYFTAALCAEVAGSYYSDPLIRWVPGYGGKPDILQSQTLYRYKTLLAMI